MNQVLRCGASHAVEGRRDHHGNFWDSAKLWSRKKDGKRGKEGGDGRNKGSRNSQNFLSIKSDVEKPERRTNKANQNNIGVFEQGGRRQEGRGGETRMMGSREAKEHYLMHNRSASRKMGKGEEHGRRSEGKGLGGGESSCFLAASGGLRSRTSLERNYEGRDA